MNTRILLDVSNVKLKVLESSSLNRSIITADLFAAAGHVRDVSDIRKLILYYDLDNERMYHLGDKFPNHPLAENLKNLGTKWYFMYLRGFEDVDPKRTMEHLAWQLFNGRHQAVTVSITSTLIAQCWEQQAREELSYIMKHVDVLGTFEFYCLIEFSLAHWLELESLLPEQTLHEFWNIVFMRYPGLIYRYLSILESDTIIRKYIPNVPNFIDSYAYMLKYNDAGIHTKDFSIHRNQILYLKGVQTNPTTEPAYIQLVDQGFDNNKDLLSLIWHGREHPHVKELLKHYNIKINPNYGSKYTTIDLKNQMLLIDKSKKFMINLGPINVTVTLTSDSIIVGGNIYPKVEKQSLYPIALDYLGLKYAILDIKNRNLRE